MMRKVNHLSTLQQEILQRLGLDASLYKQLEVKENGR